MTKRPDKEIPEEVFERLQRAKECACKKFRENAERKREENDKQGRKYPWR